MTTTMPAKRYSAHERQALLAKFALSGLSCPVFCRREGVPYSTFKNWGYRRIAATNKVTQPATIAKSDMPIKHNGFYPVKVAAPEPDYAAASSSMPPSLLRLRKPNGVLVELPVDLSAEQFSILFQALEIVEC